MQVKAWGKGYTQRGKPSVAELQGHREWLLKCLCPSSICSSGDPAAISMMLENSSLRGLDSGALTQPLPCDIHPPYASICWQSPSLWSWWVCYTDLHQTGKL